MNQQRPVWHGVVAGIAIVVLGLALFSPSAELPQTPQTVALVSVLVALGIGVIGGALMPDTFIVNGKDVKPLGLGGTATGGAAFFVATLFFLYATGVNKPQPHDASIAASTPIAAASASSPALPASAVPSPSPVPAAIEKASAPSPAPVSMPTPIALDKPDFVPLPPAPYAYRDWTYCSECCPQGPYDNCPHVGWGWANDESRAREVAITACISSGGHPKPCSENVQAY